MSGDVPYGEPENTERKPDTPQRGEASQQRDYIAWIRVAYGDILADAADSIKHLIPDDEDKLLANAMHIVSEQKYGNVNIATSPTDEGDGNWISGNQDSTY